MASIAGVRSEEEYFMIEGAARLYCKPEVAFKIREWQVAGKKVVEVIISTGDKTPYMAMDNDGSWIAYIRQGDQNLVASHIMLKVWERQKSGQSNNCSFPEGRSGFAVIPGNQSQHHSSTIPTACRIISVPGRANPG